MNSFDENRRQHLERQRRRIVKLITCLDNLHGGLRDFAVFHPYRASCDAGLPESIDFDDMREELVEACEFVEWQLGEVSTKP